MSGKRKRAEAGNSKTQTIKVKWGTTMGEEERRDGGQLKLWMNKSHIGTYFFTDKLDRNVF